MIALGVARIFFAQYKAYFVMAAIAAICAFGFYAGSGYSTLKSDKKIAALTLLHSTQMQLIKDANQLALDERQAQINNLQLEFAIADENYLEQMKNAKAENDRLINCTMSGECVQYVKIENVVCTSGATGKDNNQKVSNGATHARLDRTAAASAFRVTDKCDQAINQLNELQKRVIELAKICPIDFI